MRKLERATKQLGTLLEEYCRRTVWLNRESIAKRGSVRGAAPDAVTFALESEAQVASKVLTTASKQHAINVAASKELHAALSAVTALIQREKRGLGLNPESYSGTVQSYPRPQGTPPPAVVRVREAVRVARRAAQDTADVMGACKHELAQAAAAVDTKLKDAIARAKATEV